MKMNLKIIIKKYDELPKQLKASFWFLVCTVLQKSVVIITTPIFTRVMTAEEYGQFNVFLSWQAIITCFVTLELSAGIYTQGLIKFDENKDKFTAALQGLTLSLSIIWCCIYLFFGEALNKLFSLSTLQMLLMLVIMWTNAIFAFWATEQRVRYEYKKLVCITFISTIVQPVLGIYMVLVADDKVTARILSICIANVACYLGMFIQQIWKGRIFFSKTIWIYALKLSIPLVPHYLSVILLNSADRIMIDLMIGSKEAGIYSLAYTIARFGILLNTALLQTVNPWIYQKIKTSDFCKIQKIACPSLVLVAIFNLLLIIFTPEIVGLFAPAEYYNSIWIIPPIAMSVYFMYAYNLFSNFEFYFEKTNYVSIATLSGAILNIFLNYFCLKKIGYYAAGYTTLICYIIFAVLHYCFMRRICKKSLAGINVYNVKQMISISIAFILIGFLFMITYNARIVRYLCFIILVMCIWFNRKVFIHYFRIVVEKE